jgi:hypothetical protein
MTDLIIQGLTLTSFQFVTVPQHYIFPYCFFSTKFYNYIVHFTENVVFVYYHPGLNFMHLMHDGNT